MVQKWNESAAVTDEEETMDKNELGMDERRLTYLDAQPLKMRDRVTNHLEALMQSDFDSFQVFSNLSAKTLSDKFKFTLNIKS